MVRKIIKRKQGFLRIVEAFFAILAIAGVMLLLYIGNAPKASDEDIIYPIIRTSLKEITTNEELRYAVLNIEPADPGDPLRGGIDSEGPNYQKINESFYRTIPTDVYGYYFNICPIDNACGIDNDELSLNVLPEKSVYSDYVVIFTAPGPGYEPEPVFTERAKKLRLFVWEK